MEEVIFDINSYTFLLKSIKKKSPVRQNSFISHMGKFNGIKSDIDCLCIHG